MERYRFFKCFIITTLIYQLLLLSYSSVSAQVAQQNSANMQINPGQESGTVFTGSGTNPNYGVNLVPFGPEVGDRSVNPGLLTSGQTINLHTFFPFYGGFYNYSVLSVNGYISFATVLDQGPTINVGVEATDWPRQQDPAMIAPYLCKQQVLTNAGVSIKSGVYFRVVMRQSLFGRGSNSNLNFGGTMQQSSIIGGNGSQKCPGVPNDYVQCDQSSDYFLDEMMRWLQDGVAGAAAFRADAALVVTWYNTASGMSGTSDVHSGKTATYQAIWLTDQPGRLSYVILNYDHLGFDAADLSGNSKSGRCQALFNGGNHTGTVPVDPSFGYKNTPKILAQRSGVPHVVRGRYMFRVDDVVRPGGCSNKTGGTYPILIYPNIVNMLGEMSVDVNGVCLQHEKTYVLMVEQRQTATCKVINAALARCTLPKIYDWGTKTVYFQPQGSGANEEKAFVGYIYFVPPTFDPMRLDIGNIYDWFENPMTRTVMPLSWYPRNFTNPEYANFEMRPSDDTMYSVQLGLYVIGYKESLDDQIKKFRPEHRVICRLATYSNRNGPEYRFRPQEERITLNQIEHWYMTEWERMNELFTFRFGYLKLAPITGADDNTLELRSGLVSAPISLHWLWTTNNPQYSSNTFSQQDRDSKVKFVEKKALEMCHDWFNEDGALENFIRDTETNASCPCIERQAILDIGRFMPHPRCSQVFRDVTCTTTIGAKNCYMSSQNIYGSYSQAEADAYESEKTGRFPTHYGQVCCYDDAGKLMQTSYQPIIKVAEQTPYNPGYPLRAYEFGTHPYMGQFEVPGLSAFHHDYMPYFLCCKYAKFRCQMFYWRRPSSGCQEYHPPAIGTVIGAGSFNTIDNDKFIFNEPGVYTLLYIPQTTHTPEVRIQVRMERYPNRKVDFSLLGNLLNQAELVQPSNVTVITGIAIEATGTDRVHVLARKDTRRFRYRTSVIVGNILRYFDTMRLQRFKGVLVYVNNVERGQPEIYVVLEEAQIGIRIRESFALDIDRLLNYQESMGMLDILLSVPPQYGVRPDGDKTREQEQRQRYNLPRVSGLMRPYPDQTSASYMKGLTLNDINSESYRQHIITNYRIPGSGGHGADQNLAGTLNQDIPTDNMFTTSREEDKKYEVFPEANMKSGPIYKAAEEYESGYYQFSVKSGQDITQLLQRCTTIQQNRHTNLQPLQSIVTEQYGISECPVNPAQITQECGDSVTCLYDYTMLDAKILAIEAQKAWNTFVHDRVEATRHYNSCGPINIEYPEYMSKTPSMASGYLQGDVAQFSCFQTHWVKGTTEFKCNIVVDRNHPNSYRYEWNKGSQPWCRSRARDNLFKWLAAVFGTIGIILVILSIFLCCWCVKQKKLAGRETRANSLAVSQKEPLRSSSYPDEIKQKANDSFSTADNIPYPYPVKPAYGGANDGGTTTTTRTMTKVIRPPARDYDEYNRELPSTSSDEQNRLLGLNTSV